MTSAAPSRAPDGSVRRLAAGATAGMAALLLAGCQTASPTQTLVPYQAADGISVDLGDVSISDLLVVSTSKGSAGMLSGLVASQSAERQEVSFVAGDQAPVRVIVEPNQVRRLSGGNGPIARPLTSVDAIPGGMVALTVSTPGSGPTVVQVPVLPPQGYYSTVTVPAVVAPTAEVTSPAATESPTPTTTESPTPTSS